MEANNLGYFISIYEKFAQAENKSKRTIEAITAAVSKFDGFLGGIQIPKISHLTIWENIFSIFKNAAGGWATRP